MTVKGGVPVTLGQIGAVKVGIQSKRGDASINGTPGVILSIQKQPGSNTVKLTRQIEDALKDLERTLPMGVKVYELFEQAHREL